MTRMGGAWLLPSNDGQTLWRIHSYQEDGSAQWQDERGRWHTVTGTFWATARRPLPTDADLDRYDTEDDFVWDYDAWEERSQGHRSRREAIEETLR
jgi:hypothetical protein